MVVVYRSNFYLIQNMPKRTKRSQSIHDAAVRRIAKELEAKGFDVEADVSGYTRPGTFRGYRSDVVATKGKERKVVEVETSESVDSTRDRKQQQAFRNVASRSKHTTFKRVVVRTRSD